LAANTKEEKRKTNFFAKISRSFRDMKGEMKRVVWPTRKQVINNTIIVLAFMLVAAVIIGGFDAILWFLRGLFFQVA